MNSSPGTNLRYGGGRGDWMALTRSATPRWQVTRLHPVHVRICSINSQGSLVKQARQRTEQCQCHDIPAALVRLVRLARYWLVTAVQSRYGWADTGLHGGLRGTS